jgi:hypothetical protein
MEPRKRPDIVEFMRLCFHLLDYAEQRGGLTDEEVEDIALIVYSGRHVKRTVCPYDNLDNLAASLAFSTLPATFD